MAREFAVAVLEGDTRTASRLVREPVDDAQVTQFREAYFDLDDPVTGAKFDLAGDVEAESASYLVEEVRMPDGSIWYPHQGAEESGEVIWVVYDRGWVVVFPDLESPLGD